MLETVIPEFQSRMGELPEPLVNTAEAMAKFYNQEDYRIPLACPYCVYNNLRYETVTNSKRVRFQPNKQSINSMGNLISL